MLLPPRWGRNRKAHGNAWGFGIAHFCRPDGAETGKPRCKALGILPVPWGLPITGPVPISSSAPISSFDIKSSLNPKSANFSWDSFPPAVICPSPGSRTSTGAAVRARSPQGSGQYLPESPRQDRGPLGQLTSFLSVLPAFERLTIPRSFGFWWSLRAMRGSWAWFTGLRVRTKSRNGSSTSTTSFLPTTKTDGWLAIAIWGTRSGCSRCSACVRSWRLETR